MKQSERASRLTGEGAFSVLSEIIKLKAEGRDIVNLSIGEPAFDTPDNIKAAGCRAIAENYTHYSPASGVPAFRKTVADYVSRTRGIEVHPDEVVISPGTKSMIFHTIMACVETGSEVICANPSYPAYPSIVNLVGAKFVDIPLVEEQGFELDIDLLESKVSDRTSMIILNSPHNPTGGVLSLESLVRVADLAVKNDLWVMSDEIYSRLVYGAEFKSIASLPGMKERTILIDGFSKTYAMTGWRLGYAVMNRSLAKTMDLFMMNAESCTATFTQYAGIEALEGPQDEAERMRLEFKARRDLLVKELNKIPGFKCHVPEGAFYVFPNVTEACRRLGMAGSDQFRRALLNEAGVAVLSRSAFGKPLEGETEEYIRLSYTSDRDTLIEGARRIRDYVVSRLS